MASLRECGMAEGQRMMREEVLTFTILSHALALRALRSVSFCVAQHVQAHLTRKVGTASYNFDSESESDDKW